MNTQPLPSGVVRIEPGPGQESVWDYPRPPRIEAVPVRVRAIVAGRPIGDSIRALRVVETAGAPVYYLPPDDVDQAHLHPSTRTSLCEWKGGASYVDLVDGSRRVSDIGWTYREPNRGYEAIRDHVAFYAAKLDEAWVGDEQAEPQPGGFYGGWVTAAIVGPIKGEPGSWGW